MQGAPKFGKVELLLKDKDNGLARNKVEYDDCGMIITGDYIIIVLDDKVDIETTNTSTGKIYHMSEIDSYKTHAL
jgi:hypothetical protein|tara:strand:+ start:7207 stop:7431 length:225 start_codon:yes stop_codon:yes gene_type:complete